MEHTRRAFLATLGAGALGSTAAVRGTATQPPPFDVPALAQQVNGHRLAYLDNAATTLRPRVVSEALARFDATDNANPSAGLHTLARRSAAALDAARTRVARFLNAGQPSEIIFTRGSTEGINLVASAWGGPVLRRGDEIVVSVAEHSSNLFPWQRIAASKGAQVRMVGVQDDGRIDMGALAAALGPRTRLIAITHVSNVLGLVNPIAEVCELARRRSVPVLVDAAQSAPHVALDVQALGCDFLVFSSHKLLGPMGIGVLWVKAAHFNRMDAYHVGSNMGHGLDLASAHFEPDAFRFQSGTPNVSGPIGLAAAIGVLEDTGFAAIREHDRRLASHGLERLSAVPRLRLIGTAGPDLRAPVFAFTMQGVAVPDIVKAADAAGVAIRGGDLAALPLLRRFGADAAARASAYLYNTTEEIDRLVDVLAYLARAGR